MIMGDKAVRNKSKGRWHPYKKTVNKDNGKKQISSDNISNIQPQSPSKKEGDLNILNIGRNLDIPYYGWKLFLHDEEYKAGSSTEKHIQAVEGFLTRHFEFSSCLSLKNLEAGIPFTINITDWYTNDILISQWPNFKDDLETQPSHTLSCIQVAIYQTILNTIPKDNLTNFKETLNNVPMVRIHVNNYHPIVHLQDLKVNSYGKLISTRGCVIRVSRIKHLAQWFVFSCTKCGLERMMKQPQGIYTLPKKCNICGVSSFYPILDSPYTKSILTQIIKIQELLTDECENKGIMPRTLDVELLDGLVNVCMPGDDITLTGIVKMQGVDDGVSKLNSVHSFSLYLEAITVINNKTRCQNKNIADSEMSLKDYLTIKQVHSEPNVFTLLIHSLCPGIYGHEMIKAGLVLSLFGGTAKSRDLRDDIHVLLVGDPGLGKSQMLQACARVAAKGVYICGNSTTSSGLTVTLTKENGSNDFALEPGALVLADRGCCCIDEFDKMSTQHQALLEAMEQQSVSVAKSGTICSLSARTTILAAANPIGGRYQKSKTMKENLNISQPLLSRFDLIYFLLDTPNKHLDGLLCKHVMMAHTGINNTKNKTSMLNSDLEQYYIKKRSLREHLSHIPEDHTQVLSHSVLRKYISYARQYVKPRLSTEAAKALQEYYLNLRSKNNDINNMPIYNRQLEAMIRLTEARAKLELRVEATKDDALEVIEILQYVILSSTTDDSVPTLHNNDIGKLTNRKVKAFINLLEREVNQRGTKVFSTLELKELAMNGSISLNNFSSFISKLNEHGILLKTGKDTFKFVNN